MAKFLVSFSLLPLGHLLALPISRNPVRWSSIRRPLTILLPLDVNAAENTRLQRGQRESPPWQSAIEKLESLEQIAKQDAAAAGLVSTTLDSSLHTRLEECSQSAVDSVRDSFAASTSEKQQLTVNRETSAVNGFPSMHSNSTRTQTSLEGGDLVCRVIARSDGKLPSAPEMLVHSPENILRRLDDIYHAQAHEETRRLKYIQRPSKADDKEEISAASLALDAKEEEDLVATVRTSLEDAGFELLSRRDLDLCEALNAGYLLRLSILPDVLNLDPGIAQEFYPELFDTEGNVRDASAFSEKLLFEGRVLVFWRGYSQEVTRGRLLLPKLDHLQASLVQRLSGKFRKRLTLFERYTVINSLAVYRKATACFLSSTRHMADRVPNASVSKSLRQMIRSPYFHSGYKVFNNGTLPSVSDFRTAAASRVDTFSLARYGASNIKFVGSPNPIDALNPFTICEEEVGRPFDDPVLCSNDRAQKVNRDMYESLNSNEVCCPYDAKSPNPLPPMQLLERVSISNLVDIFTKEGRQNLAKTVFSKSELVEPTYEEVVVIWRPLPAREESGAGPYFTPPKFAYDLADMYDIQGLPTIHKKAPRTAASPLEIRTFDAVPMANLPAVLPKTKLVFRPADAFVFDLVSILSFLAIAGSIRFDNPKLDLIALASVFLWVIRTVIRYSNKLARYDLLVKKFLTSKISHRNAGALKYLATEAGSQRATRAALVHTWLTKMLPAKDEPLRRSHIISRGKSELHVLLNDWKRTPVDVDAALNDLEDLDLVRRTDTEGRLLDVVSDNGSVTRALKQTWVSLFDGKVSLRALIGRRSKGTVPT